MVNRPPLVGDWRGLSELRGDVERALARSCRDRSELEDMVQETLLRAATFRRSLHDRSRLRPWVLRIATNVMRDHVRRERRLRRADVEEDFLAELAGRDPAPTDPADGAGVRIGGQVYEDDEVLQLLVQLLPEMSETERRLYQAYYGQGVGCRRAARLLDVSTQTVKMRLFRLRRKLRRALSKESQLRLSARHAGDEAVA